MRTTLRVSCMACLLALGMPWGMLGSPLALGQDQPAEAVAGERAGWYFEALESIRAAEVRAFNGVMAEELMVRLRTDADMENVALAAELLRLVAQDNDAGALGEVMASAENQRALAALDVLDVLKGAEATTLMLAVLESDNEALIVNAVENLARRQDDRIAPVLGALAAKGSPVLRIAALDALGSMKSESSVAVLVAMDVTNDDAVRAAWQQAIIRSADANSGVPLQQALSAVFESPAARGIGLAAFGRLSAMGAPEGYEALIRVLRDPRSPLREGAFIAVARGEYPDKTAEIADLLPESAEETVLRLVQALGVRGDRAAWPRVQRLMEYSTGAVREAAITASGRLMDAEGVAPLVTIAASGSESQRPLAMAALMEAPVDQLEPEFMRLLSNREDQSEKRWVAARVASRRGMKQATPALLEMAGAVEGEQMTVAFGALKEMADPGALESLSGIVARNTTTRVLRPAGEALSASARAADAEVASQQIARFLPAATPEGAAELLGVLGELGSASSLPLMESALANEDESMRRAAIKALGRWPNAQPAGLLAGVAEKEPEGATRRLAIRSLIDMMQREEDRATKWQWVERLEKMELPREDRLRLVASVQQMMDVAAIEWLQRQLMAPDTLTEVQAAIVAVALDLGDDKRTEAEAALRAADAAGHNDQVKEALSKFAPPISSDHHILVFDMAGPFRAEGTANALATVFPPEVDGTGEWRMIKGGRDVERPWLVDLGLETGAQEIGSAAYLRTWFRSTGEREAILEMASADGLVVWLNGKEVHRREGARALAPASDRVPVKFVMGTNELLVKVAASAEAWGYSLRVAEIEGQPLTGLMVKGDGMFMMDLPVVAAGPPPPPVWSTERWEGDSFFGDYAAMGDDESVRAARVVAKGGDVFTIQLLEAFDTRQEPVGEVEGRIEGDALQGGNRAWKVSVRDGRMTAEERVSGAITVLEHVVRESPTLGAPPPEGAIVLFDGTNFDEWVGDGPEGVVTWTITEEGAAQVTPMTGSILTRREFGDFNLHLEFRAPYSPGNAHQFNGNSGVFLQVAYEVQVLQNHGSPGLIDECGAFYKLFTPDINMCYPPLSWQTYDITFHAARFDGNGKMTRPARATVVHNGVAIHTERELPETTIPDLPPPSVPRPLYLQDHHNQVQYRNIWIQPISMEGK